MSRSLRAGLAVLAAGAVVAPAALAAGSGSTVRITSPARVVTEQPRIVTLTPRIVSVAPRTPRPDTFTVGSDVLFAFGRSDLSPSARVVLGAVVSRLRHDHRATVTIIGYTDSVGTPAFNLALSRRRAASVRAYLQSTVGDHALRYRTEGRGEADPVAPNRIDGHDDPAGRQLNRRVTITATTG